MSIDRAVSVHPAWQCALRKLTNIERWNDRDKGLPGGYFDSQVALAMIIGGFGADVTVTERDADGNPAAYAFPDRWVEIDEEAGRRMGLHPRLFNEIHGAGKSAPAIFPVTARRYALNGK